MLAWLLDIQNWLVSVNSGLLPLGTIAFSFLNSWHCAFMCGSLVAGQPNRKLSQLLLLRLGSYTLYGAVLGYFGKHLRTSLELKVIGVISFIVLTIVTLLCIFPYLFEKMKFAAPSRLFSSFRGLFWGSIPCHLLMFLYGIAIITGDPIMGGGLLFIHAVMTTPALAYTNHLIIKLKRWSGRFSPILKMMIVILVLLNLFYFWGKLINGDEVARSKLIFCF